MHILSLSLSLLFLIHFAFILRSLQLDVQSNNINVIDTIQLNSSQIFYFSFSHSLSLSLSHFLHYRCNNSEIKLFSQGKRMDRGWITWSIPTFHVLKHLRIYQRTTLIAHLCDNNIDNIQRKSLIRRTSHERELSRTLARARSLSFLWHDSYTRDRIASNPRTGASRPELMIVSCDTWKVRTFQHNTY